MAISTLTEYSATVDEKWDNDIFKGRYSPSHILSRVRNASKLVTGSGDKINFTVEPRLTVGSITEGTGAFTQVGATLTSVQLTLDQYKNVNQNTTDIALAQSFWGIESTFPTQAVAALNEAYDNALCSTGWQGTAAANVIGSENAPEALLNPIIRAALLKLANARVPREDLSLAVKPGTLLITILGEDAYSKAYEIGGMEKSPLITGNLNFQILGCKVLETLEVAEVNGVYKSLLFHKEALAIGIQKKHAFERYTLHSAGVAGRGVFMSSFYGTKVVRSDHIVTINTSTN